MTLVNQISFKCPVLRVNNRDRNIKFYQESLGLKLVSEENAIAIFSAWGNAGSGFIIEESPSMRTRAVEGSSKLNQVIIKAAKASDIEALLSNGAAAHKIFKGEKGYAYEAISPEGHRFLLHAEDQLDSLVECTRPELEKQPDFKGLSDFDYDAIVFNVPDVQASRKFYQAIFDKQAPVTLDFVEADGDDLTVAPNETWDVEILEYQVPADYDLTALQAHFTNQGLSVYLDSKARLLVISDPSQIEIWFSK